MHKPLFEYARTSLLREDARAMREVADGILAHWPVREVLQATEQRMRDAVVRGSPRSVIELLDRVGEHHSLPVMAEQAARFREQFSLEDWILDIGGGTGWYWRNTTGGNVVLIDFSLEMLKAAQLLLRDVDRVLLVHADAAALPFLTASIAGWWSTQVFQHFPETQLQNVLIELRRVLRPGWNGRLYNLNPALLHCFIYRMAGRRLHVRGPQGDFELNRYTASQWRARMSALDASPSDTLHATPEYSELFFHPNFRIMPKRYPLRLERWFVARTPRLAALFARQVALIMRGGTSTKLQ